MKKKKKKKEQKKKKEEGEITQPNMTPPQADVVKHCFLTNLV